MTPIEKVIEAAKELTSFIDNLPGWHGDTLMSHGSHLEEAIKEYEAAPGLPELIIPDWPEVWVSLGPVGEGRFYDSEPYIKEMVLYGACEKFWVHDGTCSISCGFFRIPNGMHWTDAKWRVK